MSVVLDFQVNGLFPSTVGGTGTAVKYFPRLLGPSIGVAPSTPSSSSAVGSLFVPANGVFNGQSFNVYANGTIGSDTGDPSGTANVVLYAVTGSLLAPTYTSIAAMGAVALPIAGVNSWSLRASLAGDSASGLLGGNYVVQLNGVNQASSPKATTVVAGLSFTTGNPLLEQGAAFGLVIGVTFGTSDATNTAKLYQFQVSGA